MKLEVKDNGKSGKGSCRKDHARIVLMAVVVSAADVVGWVGREGGREWGRARRLGVQVAWMSSGK